jgi:hypothetical protein
MSINWLWEAQGQRPDPETGAQIVDLNSHLQAVPVYGRWVMMQEELDP